MKMKEHLSTQQGLSELLNYAHLVDDGVILNKDGAFVMSYKFRGPDINSSTKGELDGLTQTFNRMTTFMEDGWMLYVDEIRIPSLEYPQSGYFPDSISQLVDEERKQHYESEGTHYENFQFLTFVWKFPLPTVKTARHWFIEGVEKDEDTQDLEELLKFFIKQVERQVSLLSFYLKVERLNSEDLLCFLNTCITGELFSVAVPQDGAYIDVALARRELVGGYYPKIGEKYIRSLTLQHYEKKNTLPGYLEEIGTYPLVYRFSNRFIALSESTADREIKRYRKDWHNKVKGLAGLIRETFTGHETTKVNHDALHMKNQTEQALMENSSKSTRFGYWTSQVVFMHEDKQVLQQALEVITGYLERKGFVCVEESLNAVDAWVGSIPGHGSANARRMFVNGEGLAHVLPLSSIWAGQLFCPEASKLPPGSPPLFYAATVGDTPFRFHMDVSDVGHQFIGGPTGAGKSTLIDLEVAQFFRYENASVYIFDKDFSHQALTYLLGGVHYDIGDAGNLSFCPLSDLSSEKRKNSAKLYIEQLVELQNVTLTPDMRNEIHRAIENLSDKGYDNNRNMTVLCSTVQHDDVRKALKYYTLEGAMKMMDASHDGLQTSALQTFEMGWILDQRPEVYLPVLMHIFTQIEMRVREEDGKYPVMIVLEEAWLYIGHEFFANKLKDWLKTMRKYNVRVVFATQSLSDLYDPSTQTLSSVTAVILESCPTKIYLPNPGMEEEIQQLYKKMGFNERQIEIIKTAMPKREYYVVTPEGKRLINLGLEKGSLALSILGISPDKRKDMLEIYTLENKAWIKQWLVQNDLEKWSEEWEKLEVQQNKELKISTREEREKIA